MKFAILVFVFLLVAQHSFSQASNCLELKPINKVRSSFYYDFKKVRNGYALQIPLSELKDEEINKRFKKYKTIRKIGRYSYLVPVLYIFTLSSIHSQNKSQLTREESNIFTGLLLGAVATNLSCNAISNSELNIGINRYNSLILSRKIGLGMDVDYMQNNQKLISLGISYNLGIMKFKHSTR